MAETTLGSLAIALAAGAAGTAAMTLSQALEQRATARRRPRTAASVAENATGQRARTEEERDTASSALHWLYGTGLGAALVPLESVSEPYRSLTFLGGVYGAGLAFENFGADAQEAPSRRSTTEMGADFVHHLVYAGTATLAYNGLKSAFFSEDRDQYDDTGGYAAVTGRETGTGAAGTATAGLGSVGTNRSSSPAARENV